MAASKTRILDAWWTSPTSGVVELDQDWTRKRLPPLYFGPPRQRLTLCEAAPLVRYGEMSGYYSDGERLSFLLSPTRYPHMDLEAEDLYVAGSFNGWGRAVGKKTWRLQRHATV